MKCCICKQDFVPQLNRETWRLSKCHDICLEYKTFLLDIHIKKLEEKLEKKYESRELFKTWKRDL